MDNKTARIFSAIMIFAGLSLGYMFLYRPIEAAKNLRPEVKISLQATFLIVILLLTGGIQAIFGARWLKWLNYTEQDGMWPQIAMWSVVVVTLGIGLALHEWLRATLSAYGRSF